MDYVVTYEELKLTECSGIPHNLTTSGQVSKSLFQHLLSMLQFSLNIQVLFLKNKTKQQDTTYLPLHRLFRK